MLGHFVRHHLEGALRLCQLKSKPELVKRPAIDLHLVEQRLANPAAAVICAQFVVIYNLDSGMSFNETFLALGHQNPEIRNGCFWPPLVLTGKASLPLLFCEVELAILRATGCSNEAVPAPLPNKGSQGVSDGEFFNFRHPAWDLDKSQFDAGEKAASQHAGCVRRGKAFASRCRFLLLVMDLPVAVDAKHEDARVNFANIQVRFAGQRPKSIALSIEHTPVDGLVDELPLLVVFGCRRRDYRQLGPFLIPLLPLLVENGEWSVVLCLANRTIKLDRKVE